MTLLTQVDSRNAYLQVHSESDCENPGELESQTTHYPCPPRMIQLFQAALWCLAGSALVGFAVSVLWWDPVCPGPQVSHSNPVRYNSTKARLDQARFDSWKKAHRKGKDECDPFHEQGYLHFNATDPGDNTWRPYRPDCKPSNLFEQLKQDLHFTTPTFGRNQNDRFNWLRNRTVVLIGDSIDRYELEMISSSDATFFLPPSKNGRTTLVLIHHFHHPPGTFILKIRLGHPMIGRQTNASFSNIKLPYGTPEKSTPTLQGPGFVKFQSTVSRSSVFSLGD